MVQKADANAIITHSQQQYQYQEGVREGERGKDRLPVLAGRSVLRDNGRLSLPNGSQINYNK